MTQVIKVCVGRPRPDMISRCNPVEGAANRAVWGLATIAVCQNQTGSRIDDGFKSFPSGHTSLAFAGLGFLALYLAGKMHLLDRRGYAIKAWLTFAPLCGAALIGVSRTMDYRHHATDVIAGGLLGLVTTIIIYHLYYPVLTSPNCHLPFSPRIPRSTDVDDPHATAARPNEAAATPYRTPAVALRPQDSDYSEEEGVAPRPNGYRAGPGKPSAYGRVGSRDLHDAGRKDVDIV